MNIVHLSENAYLSILISTIEAFPSKFLANGGKKPKHVLPEGEVYGLLFGQRVQKNQQIQVFNVGLAVPMQIVEVKTADGVTASPRHEERIRDILSSFPMLQFLGAFHSHPYPKNDFLESSAANFSEADEESSLAGAEQEGQPIAETIVGITHLSRRENAAPGNIKDHLVRGYCGQYKFVLAAYYTDLEEECLALVDNLLCPTALGIWNRDLV